MERTKLPIMLSLLIIAASTTFALGASTIFVLASVTSSSWEGTGEIGIGVSTLPAPRIVSVTFDKWSITPGDWVTITVKAINDGGTAEEQYVQIGLPFNPPIGDIQIFSHDFNTYAKPIPAGTEVTAGYGSYKITTKYIVVEACHTNWAQGVTRTLQVKVKFPNIDTCAFDIKTIAILYNPIRCYYNPSSGMVDQQDEYVSPYLILRKFQVSVTQGGTALEAISITNHNRYPYKKTQPSMRVDTFSVTDYGGFKGTITATNLGLTIAPGSTGMLEIKVSATSDCPLGTYTIKYRVSGTP